MNKQDQAREKINRGIEHLGISNTNGNILTLIENIENEKYSNDLYVQTDEVRRELNAIKTKLNNLQNFSSNLSMLVGDDDEEIVFGVEEQLRILAKKTEKVLEEIGKLELAGNSSINDVTTSIKKFKDEMESAADSISSCTKFKLSKKDNCEYLKNVYSETMQSMSNNINNAIQLVCVGLGAMFVFSSGLDMIGKGHAYYYSFGVFIPVGVTLIYAFYQSYLLRKIDRIQKLFNMDGRYMKDIGDSTSVQWLIYVCIILLLIFLIGETGLLFFSEDGDPVTIRHLYILAYLGSAICAGISCVIFLYKPKSDEKFLDRPLMWTLGALVIIVCFLNLLFWLKWHY